MKRRALTIFMAFAIMATGLVFPGEVYAADDLGGATNIASDENPVAVAGFRDLGVIQNQTIHIGAYQTAVFLPGTIAGFDTNGADLSIPAVTWQIDRPFDSSIPGTFVYKAVLPSGYMSDSQPPSITVQVTKNKTLVYDLLKALSRTAGSQITDGIVVTNPNGRTIKLQRYNPTTKTWSTKWSKQMSTDRITSISIAYPSIWYSTAQSQWRVHIAADQKNIGFTSPTIAVKANRVYQNPTGYYQLLEKVTLKTNAGYNLIYGTMGLKVAMVQRKLGMGMIREIMGPLTQDRVRSFQRSKGLPVTGVVNYTTWKKIGFSDYDWYYKAAYISPLKVNLTSTRAQCIEAFVANAYRYVGTEYIIGAAGAPKTGIDCSGLVMQSMYATGINPEPISVIRHSQPGYEYESRNLWASSSLKTVSYADRKRGDLIFYKNAYGTIIHVAIYLGNNKVIESTPPYVRVSDAINPSYTRVKGVKRVFN